jgi:hypothetical protein
MRSSSRRRPQTGAPPEPTQDSFETARRADRLLRRRYAGAGELVVAVARPLLVVGITLAPIAAHPPDGLQTTQDGIEGTGQQARSFGYLPPVQSRLWIGE